MTESQYWLSGLSDDLPYAALETGILEISSVCDRARRLQRQLGDCSISREELTRLIQEMYSIDAKAAQWRQRPEWSFRTVSRKDIVGDEDAVSCLPETVELHRDIWMAYEWNYHRTARIILHQQLIESLEKGGNSYESPSTSTMPAEFSSWMESSTRTVQLLAEQVVSTAAQSLGDIDHIAICINDSPPQYQAVGAYLLLWPIKIIKDPRSKVDESQRRLAQAIFERIREVTKMRSHLGSLSII